MHRTIFTHRFFGTEKHRHRENCTHRLHKKRHTKNCCTQKLYPEQSLHSRHFPAQKPFRTDFLNGQHFFTDRWFLHRKFSAQKSYAQKVLRTTFFTYRRFFTQMSLHGRRIAHRNLCTQNTFTRNQLLYTERFCFPFLITYLSCSPSQVL